MNKKSTLLAAGLMAVSSLTVSAADVTEVPSVGSDQWVAGNYYYLKNNAGDYLAIYPENQDSVVLADEAASTKELADLALWEITYAGTETSSNVYQFVNKKTKKTLSFAKNLKADPTLKEGVDKWSFDESGKGRITAKISSTETMTLSRDKDNKVMFEGDIPMVLTVTAPRTDYPLKATDLGDGFSTFQLSFGDKIEGDIFSGKDLIATEKDGCLMLQEKGKEAEGYFGIDTLMTAGAGYNFSLDSIRGTVRPNEAWKKFKFTADLKNDSLTMWVSKDPAGNTDVKVVYMQLGDKKVLTVSKKDENKGIAPFITTSRGVPAKIATGTGVYFLKSASKGKDGGKYYYGDGFKAEKPSVNKLDGQWYIKEEGGLYSIAVRKGTGFNLTKTEVFAVQGMANTFTFAGKTDSITVEYQNVDVNNKYLGSLYYTKEERVNNGYVLNLVPAGAETSSSYAFTSDSLLKITNGEAKDAVIFKLDSVDIEEVGGASALNDKVSILTYRLRSQFSDKYVAYDDEKKCLKISADADKALHFQFNVNVDGGKYDMEIVSTDYGDDKYITADSYSSNMILSKTPAYFNFVEMEAPEYASFDNGHKRLTYNNNSLVMNPNTLLAEMKIEGNDIATKAGYEADNFSLWVEKAEELVDGKQLYLISSANPKVNATTDRFYLAANDTLGDIRAVFAYNDTIKTAKGSHALFAFKTAEDGGFYLENQTELGKADGVPYVGMVNGFAVMQKDPTAAFEVESASAPVANENITEAATVRLIGSVGEFTIQNAAGKKITISNILGQTIGTRYISSDYVTVPTARGVIIVSVEGDKAYKVIVK